MKKIKKNSQHSGEQLVKLNSQKMVYVMIIILIVKVYNGYHGIHKSNNIKHQNMVIKLILIKYLYLIYKLLD